MGIPGAGKSRVAEEYVARGYLRLNRDERGGSLRALADELDEVLAAGARQVVLDNTYLTRAARSHVLDAASRHGVATRCVWIDTPLAQAQVNLVERLLDRFGSLPTPAELRLLARSEQGVLAPTSQMRSVRELEPPSIDEGFADVEQVTFARDAGAPERGSECSSRPPRSSTAGAALDEGDRSAPHLVFDWRPDGARGRACSEVARLAAEVAGPVESAMCPHPRRPADLLVPPAASRSAARVRAGARRRSGAVDSHRRRPGAPDAGDDARRPIRRGLIALTSW